MKKQFLLCIILSCMIISCKDKCDDTRDILTARDATIYLSLINKVTGGYLIKDTDAPYTIADISIKDSSEKPLLFGTQLSSIPGTTNDQYYKISIGLFQELALNTGVEIRKKIFLDLKMNRDTIEYTVKLKEGMCGAEIEYLKVWYNGTLVSETSDVIDVSIDVRR